jgi:hypothetical protein
MQETNKEVARTLARQLRAYRVSPRGAAMTQLELSKRSGIGLTPLKRFEATGGITLHNFIAILRALGLLERLIELVPAPETPSPMELLKASKMAPRLRAPRQPRSTM